MPKFVYHDEKGRYIHAGGLLMYDETGIWVIKEYYKNSYKLIDPGGKYSFQDCDIINTIWREFCEETYFVIDNLAVSKLKELLNEGKAEMLYVCKDNFNNPTYCCLLINVKHLDLNLDGIRDKFIINRNKAIKNNPFVPQNYYTSVDICHINYKDITQFVSQFHFRLKQIMINSFLKAFYINDSDSKSENINMC